MRRSSIVRLAVLLSAGTLFPLAIGRAAEKADPGLLRANEIVSAALDAEASGNLDERRRLLDEAIAQSADAAAAQWNDGRIAHGTPKKREWMTVEESIADATKDANLTRYRDLRAKTPDTVDGHWKLAKWCGERKLADQARASQPRGGLGARACRSSASPGLRSHGRQVGRPARNRTDANRGGDQNGLDPKIRPDDRQSVGEAEGQTPARAREGPRRLLGVEGSRYGRRGRSRADVARYGRVEAVDRMDGAGRLRGIVPRARPLRIDSSRRRYSRTGDR
ncbi:MAG: hypothetical protein QM811_07850 [Pirellulales bacterium]